MSYNIFLSTKAEKKYKNLDLHIGNRIKHKLNTLKQDPHKGFNLTGKYAGLKYVKVTYKGVEYRVVYDISDKSDEVLIIFLGVQERTFIKN